MSPYAPQQAPQFQHQPGQSQFNVIDELLGQILRAVPHIIAKRHAQRFLDRVAAMDDPTPLTNIHVEVNDD